MNDIFSDKEKQELEALNERPELMSALKKVFLADIYINGTLNKDNLMGDDYQKNFAFSLSFDPRTGNEFARTDEDLGRALRACNEALRMLSIAFQKIGKFKKIIEIDTTKKSKHI